MACHLFGSGQFTEEMVHYRVSASGGDNKKLYPGFTFKRGIENGGYRNITHIATVAISKTKRCVGFIFIKILRLSVLGFSSENQSGTDHSFPYADPLLKTETVVCPPLFP